MRRIYFPTAELVRFKTLYHLNHECVHCGSWFNCGRYACEKNHITCQLCVKPKRPRKKRSKPVAVEDPPLLPTLQAKLLARYVPPPPPPKPFSRDLIEPIELLPVPLILARLQKRFLDETEDYIQFYRSELRWWEYMEALLDSTRQIEGLIRQDQNSRCL